MLNHVERNHGFQHRHLDELAFTGAFLVQQGDGDGLAQGQADNLVCNGRRHITNLAVLTYKQTGQTRGGLYGVVIRRLGTVRPVLPEAVGADINYIRL